MTQGVTDLEVNHQKIEEENQGTLAIMIRKEIKDECPIANEEMVLHEEGIIKFNH